METAGQSNVPQPPKQSAYTQPSNPVSQNPLEQRSQQAHQHPRGGAAPQSSSIRTAGTYGAAPAAIHRTASSNPSSDDKLAELQRNHEQRVEPERKRGHIDTEYGVEQQPAEGDIAAAVKKEQPNASYNRVQPGAHAGAVGTSTPGYEQDMAAHMDRKREEHDRILGQDGGKSPSFDAEDAERRQLRERRSKQNEQLDVKGAVKSSAGDPVV